MNRIAIFCASATALALSACGGTDEAEHTTVIETETIDPGPAPTVTETTTVIEQARAEDHDSVMVTRDGVDAEISDGDTRVTVDADENPSVRVRD